MYDVIFSALFMLQLKIALFYIFFQSSIFYIFSQMYVCIYMYECKKVWVYECNMYADPIITHMYSMMYTAHDMINHHITLFLCSVR